MKKFLLRVLLFFIIAAIIDRCVGATGNYLQTHAKGGSTKAFNDLVMKDRHDILILGSSRAHHHYDAPFLSDSLRLDVYNAGYNGNGVILAYGILQMTLKNYKPKLIIFDVEPAFDINVYDEDNHHKRYLAELKPYYHINEIGAIIKDISLEEYCKVQSGMMRYNTTIIKKIVDNVLHRKNPDHGYLPIDGVFDGQQSDNKKKKANSQIDSVKIEYVERIILLSQMNNVPIMLVASPKFRAIDTAVFTPVKSICKQYDVPFYDYYTTSLFNDHAEWFNEPMHLNRFGAREFSKEVISSIGKSLDISME